MLAVSREIKAPPAQLWDLLVSPAHWPAWGPSIRAAEGPALALGSRGRVQTSLGLWLPFEVTGYVEGVWWRWRVASIPATGHRVEQLSSVRSRVTFEVPALAAPYLAVCALALRNLERLV